MSNGNIKNTLKKRENIKIKIIKEKIKVNVKKRKELQKKNQKKITNKENFKLSEY